MNVLFFLNRRTVFVRGFYENSSAPFLEIQRKITEEEEPYEIVWDGSEEPPYTSEWVSADESIQILRYTCLSMLTASLHLYLKTWETLSGKAPGKKYASTFKNGGWLAGYQEFFENEIGVKKFSESGANLDLLKELILARNRIQHPVSITSQLTTYSGSDLKKLPKVLFIDPQREVVFDIGPDGEEEWLIPPTVSVTSGKLYDSTIQIEKFAEWFERSATKAIYNNDA